jgi:hypothetical protein
VLQDLAGGVWISNITHNVNHFGDGVLYTVLILTLDRMNTATYPGEFRLRLVFTPFGL